MGTASAVFTSCSGDSEAENTTLLVDRMVISATATEAIYYIAVTSNRGWIVSSDAEWCTLISPSGTRDGKVTVVVGKNTTTSSRSATITVTTKTTARTVTVTQEAANATLTLDQTAISAPSAAASYLIAVASNVSWMVSSDAGWCTLSPPFGTNNGIITVNVGGNTTTNSRSATITVTAGAVTQTVTVTQAAANATLTLDQTSISATPATASYPIVVTSNSTWTVSSNVGWCTMRPLSGTGNGTITVSVAENTTASSRSAIITVTAGAATQMVIVTQAAANTTFTLDKTAISAPSAAASYPIAVTSNVSWLASVSSDAGWCTINPTSGTNSGVITVNVAENTTTSSRWAIITVAVGAATQMVSITQAAANATLTLDKTSVPATSAAANYTVGVTSNSEWTVSSNVGWCTISPLSGTGNGTITVNVGDNTTTSSRSATITVTAGTVTQTVTVTQAAANATLTLDKTAISATATAANYPIVVTSNSTWTVSSNAGWCTINPTSGAGNGTITVNVGDNTTTNSRSATITVTAGTVTQTVTVTQAAANATLTLDKTAISATATAASYPIVVTSNSTWTVSSNAGWCTINPTSGTGNGTFTVSVAENTTASSRSATVTVTTGAVTKTVTITQAAPAALVSNFTETGGGLSFYMIGVAGGTFTMGATAEQGGDYNSDERPIHSVTLSNYAIGKYEVTQKLWWDVMSSWPNLPPPSKYGAGDNYPMTYVSYNDIQNFLVTLNTKTGKTYRLPTEAEWEYAARGGDQSNGYKYSGSNTIDDVAWYRDNSGNTTHPVGTKDPNELGIYDMSSNAAEWCSDWYVGYSSSSQTNPIGAVSGSQRVDRGGGFSGNAVIGRVSFRDKTAPSSYGYSLGFRLVLPL
ncbi:hypothetical protein AGMMS4957_04870 [Bacteroidia bacterium]|nr:hypothetical protein AGMMS4957_04870 [Bacteroidia bacterium]